MAGELTSAWRNGVMIVIPKAKGCPTDPKSWRGINEELHLQAPVQNHPEETSSVSRVQRCHSATTTLILRGFSTLSACKTLHGEIRNTLNTRSRLKNRRRYAIFISFTAAFDTGSRKICLSMFAENGVAPKMLELLCSLLQRNRGGPTF